MRTGQPPWIKTLLTFSGITAAATALTFQDVKPVGCAPNKGEVPQSSQAIGETSCICAACGYDGKGDVTKLKRHQNNGQLYLKPVEVLLAENKACQKRSRKTAGGSSAFRKANNRASYGRQLTVVKGLQKRGGKLVRKHLAKSIVLKRPARRGKDHPTPFLTLDANEQCLK